LLYHLGFEPNDIYHPATVPINDDGKSVLSLPEKNTSIDASIPQIANKSPDPTPDKSSTTLPPLPSQQPPTLHQITAAAARTEADTRPRRVPQKRCPADLTADFGISKTDMATVYLSPDPYFDAFEQELDLRKFNHVRHPTAGLDLHESNGRIHLKCMIPSTPAAKIPDWHARVQGAWLIKVADQVVSKISDVETAIASEVSAGCSILMLLFAHPEI
jgi:hypothetical protein